MQVRDIDTMIQPLQKHNDIRKAAQRVDDYQRQRSEPQEQGAVLLTVLMLLGLLAILTTTAMITATTELKIGKNHKTGEQAFYDAAAGIEEAIARLRQGIAAPVLDNYPQDPNWTAYIGQPEKVSALGYDAGNSLHSRYDSLTPVIAPWLTIKHAVDLHGNVLYWGDKDGNGTLERNSIRGEPIYMITSNSMVDGSRKHIIAEAARFPTLTIPAALYAGEGATLTGPLADIIGTDGCGIQDKPDIATTLGPGSITTPGTPDVKYDAPKLNIKAMIKTLAAQASLTYEVLAASHNADTRPGPGDGWGAPVEGGHPQAPATCNSGRIIYYRTGGTYVKLGGGVAGCGILMVDGNLEIDGSFSWYGTIVVTGSIIFYGIETKHITGAMLAGETVTTSGAQGNIYIVHCHTAVSKQTETCPLTRLSWMEQY